MIGITLLTPNGNGYTRQVRLHNGTTIGDLFDAEMRGSDLPEDFRIRVNRTPVASDYVLQDKDLVTISPKKIEGAV